MSLKNTYKNYGLLGLLLVSLSLFLIPHSYVELIYGKGIFSIIRLIISPLVWLPFPLIYFLTLGVVIMVLRLFFIRRPLLSKIKRLAIGLSTFILLFYWLWAYNYRRIDFDSRYPLIPTAALDSTSLLEELQSATDEMLLSRPLNPSTVYRAAQLEDMIRPYVKDATQQFGYRSAGLVRVKELLPAGILLRIKTAGFYLPYVGEAYIDAGLHPLQKPFTMAHEMSHGFGVTDEGACNFLAYLATFHHPDSSIRYRAAMGYYRYVAGEYRWRYPNHYSELRAALPATIQHDLDDINRQMLKYPDIFPKVRDQIYNKYLTVQGVKEGLASYDKIIDYVRQARAQGLLDTH